MSRLALVAFAAFLVVTAMFARTRPIPRQFNAEVPFIGCSSSGQAGELSAPKQESVRLTISAAAAKRLAYYKAEQGPGTLAPRGWHCFEVYGSNGGELYVSQERIPAVTSFYSSDRAIFAGAAIELRAESGDTSGRFAVAQVVASVFLAHKAFVDRIIAENLYPASSFRFGPYPHDKMTYRSNEMAEYETSANTDGLGTIDRLKKNGEPILGVAILAGDPPSLLQLSARLPPSLVVLSPIIIQQFEGGFK
jgi:hypothetical protein